jgi:tetratricopeptide (TPR) repeat protein
MITSSISLCRNLGEAAIHELAGGLVILAGNTQQEYEKEILYLRESLAISQQKQYHLLESDCLFHLASCAFEKGDFPQAESYLQRSLMLCRKIGVTDGIASRLIFLGWAARYRGDRCARA